MILIKQVFSQFDDYLRKKGYMVAGGQIVNATLVPVPMQPNTRQENRAVQEGIVKQGKVVLL